MKIETIEKTQITELAEQIYEQQREDFVESLEQRIKNSIDIGMAQIENGEFMTLEESKDRLYKAFFNKPNEEL